MKRTTVLLADDHSIVVEGLRRVLETDFDVVDVVEDGLALVKAAERLKPDIIVVDVSMPLLNGIEATRQIRATNLRSKIVFLSMHPDVVYVSEALQAGGSAYVLKSSAGIEIVTAIRKVLQGGTFITLAIDKTTLEAQIRRDLRSPDVLHSLSQRRREVLQMVAEGRSTKEIAEVLNISPRTVEFHRYRAMESLGVHTIAELVLYAIKHAWCRRNERFTHPGIAGSFSSHCARLIPAKLWRDCYGNATVDSKLFPGKKIQRTTGTQKPQ